MISSKRTGQGRRRQRAIQAGIAAVSAASAGLFTARAAQADITNGFAGFAPFNFTTNGNGTQTGIGYNTSSNTFELTNNQGGEAVSGFDTTAQNITSFDATYDYVASGSADGGAFVIENNPAGTAALGNPGSSGGYEGMSNSAGLQYEYYSGSGLGDGVAFTTNGAAPSAYQSTQNVTLNSGDPIQVTVEYFNNTVTASFIDLKTGAAGQRIFSGQNIPAAVGGNLALVGFTGATGGATSTQTVSNFTFVSGESALGARDYEPIAVTGFNQQGIVTVAGGTAAVTATMDNGTTLSAGGNTWYEKGYNTAAPTTGLPTSGSTFTSQEDSQHIFTMQSYSGNDVVLLDPTSSGTLTLATPTPYSALSFLTSSGNGPSSFKVTIDYSDGATATSGLSVISPDWFDGSPSAWSASGRYDFTGNAFNNVGTPNPNLYEEDLILPDSTDPISSISMTYSGGGNIMVFALSGVAVNNAATLFYDGSGATAGKFDNSTLTFGLNSASGTPTAFSSGDIVVFDDTAADAVHNITVATVPGGIKPIAMVFNNSTNTNAYTFTGAGISGPGTITLNGNGTVILDNPNTFSGAASVNAGLLVIGSGGDLASNVIQIAPGSGLNVSGGTLTGTSLNLSNGGTVNFAGSSLTLIGFGGGGAFNSTNAGGTSLVLGNGSSGSLGGTYSGPLSLGTGSITVNVNSSTMTLSGSNSYSGGTLLQSGTLLVGNGSLGSAPLNLSGGAIGAALADTNITNQIIGGALTATSGNNLLELSNSANSFTGPIVVQSGTLQIDGPSVIGSTTSLTVESGASFLVNDASGNAGLGTTMTISGPGVTTAGATVSGPSGALRGADNVPNDVWAGNVNVSGTAYISAGANGGLYLTGSITGSGTLVFTANANTTGGTIVVLAPSGSNANTYTGETQILAGPSAATYDAVQLGANNGISPNSGLNILPGTSGNLQVDLNGYNQSLTYLTGAAEPGFELTTTSTGPSTLTITSGLKAGQASIFATAITGNVSLVMNDPTGTGNQILAGANTYTGTTTITKGTLTAASSGALSSGPVTLNGGTLSLTAVGANTTSPVVTSASFGSFVLTEGSAGTFAPTVTNGTLQLTENGVNNIANSAFYPTPVPVSDSQGFTATFQYQSSFTGTDPADGITFVLQNDPRGPAAVGAAGNSLGYYSATTPITNSAAVEFETYPPSGTGYGTAFGSEGLVPGSPGNPVTNYTSVLPINMTNNDVLDISLVYNGPAQTLLETIVDTTTGATFDTIFTGIDYSALVGGPAGGSTTAYLGFTASTGGANSSQGISNFSYTLGYTTPQSIGNTIQAATGTTSTIQIGVTNSLTTNTASVGAIQINSGATVHVTALGSGFRGVLATPSVSIAPTGQLDLGSNDLDIAAGGNTLAQVTALVASGYNNGKWNGSGIASSAAAADTTHLTALGVIVNDNGSGTPLYGTGGAIASTFDGDTLAADGDILVKYTYYGDATLQGSVSATDYSRIDNGYLNGLTGWYNGDFNYDGVVNGSDYTLIDNAYNMQGASNPLAEYASSTAQIAGGAGTSAVPEPASLGLFALGAAGLLGKRRRRR